MFGKRNAPGAGVTGVTPIRAADRMFCVEAVRLVPVVYRVVLPAPDAASACRLATEVIAAAPESGALEYAGASDTGVREVRVMPAGEPSRPVAVPIEFRIGGMKRNIRFTPGDL